MYSRNLVLLLFTTNYSLIVKTWSIKKFI